MELTEEQRERIADLLQYEMDNAQLTRGQIRLWSACMHILENWEQDVKDSYSITEVIRKIDKGEPTGAQYVVDVTAPRARAVIELDGEESGVVYYSRLTPREHIEWNKQAL